MNQTWKVTFRLWEGVGMGDEVPVGLGLGRGLELREGPGLPLGAGPMLTAPLPWQAEADDEQAEALHARPPRDADERHCASDSGRAETYRALSGNTSNTGNRSVNRVPVPTSLHTSMSPPSKRAFSTAMASPRPLPLPLREGSAL